MYLRRSARMPFLFGLWLTLLCFGIFISLEYEKTPARVVQAVGPIPSSLSTLPSPAKEFQLLMFAHPKCACTKASLSELARFMYVNNTVETRIYFIVPRSYGSWKDSETVKIASKIPGVAVSVDYDGAIAKSYQAVASGECFLFDRKSNLLFHGGITQSRGHEGANAGLDQISSIVRKNTQLTAHNAVYGCALFDAKEP